MKHLNLTILFCVIAVLPSYAQDDAKPIEQIIADIFEQYTAENEETPDFELFYESLLNTNAHPVNLNGCSKQDLEKLPFLSAIQIENILYYSYRYGGFNTIYELQLVDGLDMTDITRMLPFVKVGEKSEKYSPLKWNEIMKYGNHKVYYKLKTDLEKKTGYLPDTSGTKYSGSPFYNSIRYRFQFSNRVSAGLTTEKDPGEPIFTNKNPLYDFTSGYICIDNTGKMKRLIAGDFKPTFGLGLVLQSGFNTGKSSYVLNVSPYNQGLNKGGSTDESHFFRGVGVNVTDGNIDFTLFYSNKMLDADTTGGHFSSFYTSGLHRTKTEFSKKQTVNQQVAGGNITFSYNNLRIGLTAVHTILDKALQPEVAHYNVFRFSGNKQSTAGINYKFRVNRFNFFGETAVENTLGVASLNGVMFSPVSRASLVLLHRYYSKKFDSFYANAFSESSRNGNETGFYSGIEIYPFKKWKLSAYADSYKFLWTTYNIASPAIGADFLLKTEYKPRKDLSMFWKLKYEKGSKNQSDSITPLAFISNYWKGNIRYQLNFNTGYFQLKTLFEGSFYNESSSKLSTGVSLIQDISYNFKKIPIETDVRYQIFDIQTYENRIYNYENDILYDFSIPAVYGVGTRYYLNIKWKTTEKLSLWFRFAQTVYGDKRETIGSGGELIMGNRTSDVKLMLAYYF